MMFVILRIILLLSSFLVIIRILLLYKFKLLLHAVWQCNFTCTYSIGTIIILIVLGTNTIIAPGNLICYVINRYGNTSKFESDCACKS